MQCTLDSEVLSNQYTLKIYTGQVGADEGVLKCSTELVAKYKKFLNEKCTESIVGEALYWMMRPPLQ